MQSMLNKEARPHVPTLHITAGTEQMQKMEALKVRYSQLKKQADERAQVCDGDVKLVEKKSRRAIVVRKLKQLKAVVKEQQAQIGKVTQQNWEMNRQIAQKQQTIQALKQLQADLETKHQQTKLTVEELKDKEQKCKRKVMTIIKQRGELAKKYLGMDSVGGCSKEEWKAFMAAEEAETQLTDPLSHEEILIKELMARHLSRAANTLSFIARFTRITLPYEDKGQMMKLEGLKNRILRRSNSSRKAEFNRAYLRCYEANSIYLFSRLGISMSHPDLRVQTLDIFERRYLQWLNGEVEEGQTLELDSQVETPEMIELSLASVAGSRGLTESKQHKYWMPDEVEEIEFEEIVESMGLREIKSSSDSEDSIEVLE